MDFNELKYENLPDSRSDYLDDGTYSVVIVDAGFQPPKNGGNYMLVLEYKINEGPLDGVTKKDYLCLFHDSEQTKRIARSKLKLILNAINSSDQLNPENVRNVLVNRNLSIKIKNKIDNEGRAQANVVEYLKKEQEFKSPFIPSNPKTGEVAPFAPWVNG